MGEDIKNLLDRYKLSKGCSICGYKEYACALLFHHRDADTKIFDIGNAQVRGFGIDNINVVFDEVDKCDVLCFNCHQVLHYGNGSKQ